MINDKKIPVRITVTGIHKNITDASPETGINAEPGIAFTTAGSLKANVASEKTGSLEADLAFRISGSLEADITSETAEGILSRHGSSIYLRYSLPLVNNLIKISPACVEVTRTVSVSPESDRKLCSKTIYIEGEREGGIQDTPYGRLDTGTDTKSIVCMENDALFSCTVCGIMYINNSPSSVFELKIEAVML